MAGVIVHEWLSKYGGSENVVDSMLETFPDATLIGLWNDAPERFPRAIESPLARTPLRGKKALALPFMPRMWSQLDLGSPDFAILSSHLFAHHADWRNRAETRRFVYAYTPARYMWVPELDERGRGLAARMVSSVLRPVDRRVASTQSAQFAAISGYVRDRIAATWGVESRVIYPPVSVARVQAVVDWKATTEGDESRTLASLPDEFLLGASRFVQYKRLDRVIQAGRLSGLPVVLAGRGPDRARLQEIAEASGVRLTIVDSPSDEMLYALYQMATAYVFLPVEDFGIMPIEAMALGTPVVVANSGGGAETAALVSGGVSVDPASDDELSRAIATASTLDMTTVRHAVYSTFDESRFRLELRRWVNGT